MERTFEEYAAALRKRQELKLTLSSAEQQVTLLDQLVTYLSLHLPNATHNPQLHIIREESSKALLRVAKLVNNYGMDIKILIPVLLVN